MSEDPFVSSSPEQAGLGRLRGRWGFVVLLAVFGAGTLGALAASAFALAFGLFFVGSLVALAWHMALDRLSTNRSDLRIESGPLRVDRHETLLFRRRDGGWRALATREELVQGFVIPSLETLVRLERRRGRPALFVRVRDEREGVALLRALGLDATRIAAEMKGVSGYQTLSRVGQATHALLPLVLLVVVSVIATRVGRAGDPFIYASFLLWFGHLLALNARTSIRVGTDGLHLRWLGRERFIERARIAGAVVHQKKTFWSAHHGVLLTLDDGKTEWIPMSHAEDALRLTQRFEEASTSTTTTRASSALRRAGRPTRDWIRDLRRLGGGAVDHRTAAIPTDDLLRVVQDSRAPVEERVSAALAAISAADPEAKQRVRVAAEASASPRLRVALARIADDAEEDALVDALEKLELSSGP